MYERYKDETIGEHEYRIERMLPHVGRWLLSLFSQRAAGALKKAEEKNSSAPAPEGMEPPDIQAALMATASYLVSNLSLEEGEQVQNLCMSSCFRYEEIGGQKVAMPIMINKGHWAIEELKYDSPTVLELMRHSVAFNISPFFTGAGSTSTT